MKQFAVLLLVLLTPTLLFAQQNQRTIVIGDSTRFNEEQEVTLRGRVTNASTNLPVPGATVFFTRLQQGTATSEDGTFSISIKPGKYTVRFQFVGLETVIVNLSIYEDGNLPIQLNEETLNLDELIVQGRARDANINSVTIGVEQLSIDDIDRLPSFMGEVDVVNSLILLPGVNTVGEGASGFNVRGGRVDQNLVLFNGAPLFNSSHALGLFSVFNPDITENFTLYKGHIPAKYGGRLSSVLDVTTKSGDFEKYRIRGGLGIVASRLAVEGPLVKDKTSLLLAGRASYSDWVLNLAENPDVKDSEAGFYDLNAILTHKINPNNRLILSYYGSDDRFEFSRDFGYSWNTQQFNLRWLSLVTQKLQTEVSANYNKYVSTFFEPDGFGAFDLENGVGYSNVKIESTYKPNSRHTIEAGGEFTGYDIRPEELLPRGTQSIRAAETVDNERGREFAFYLSDDFRLNDRLTLSAGLRFSIFQNVGAATVFSYQPGVPRSPETITDTTTFSDGEIIKQFSGLEPRLSARFKLNDRQSLKISYNRARQYVHLISNTASPTPADVWQTSNDFIPPQVSDNYSAGYFHNFNNNAWETSFELFYKDISDLVEYKNFAELFLNETLETELLSGKGRAYGTEFYVKRNQGDWTGWVSYSISRTEVKVDGDFFETSINNGEWFPSDFDQTHNFTLSAHRQLSTNSSFSTNFTFSTGRPITAIESSFIENDVTIPVFSDRNEYRIPDYMRLDISFTIGDNVFKGRKPDPNSRYDDTLTIAFYNLFGRRNAFSVFYRRPEGFFIPKPTRLSVLGAVIPAVTYNVKFN